ncbi:hypothetical protein [Leeia oryzae]|uniref:hypothetical protein n=1 Tax=Leeia oryzae TaxID=356662 RepID=UPI000373733C|nr:hypothetical protein [Leeia oryzae]
MDFQQDLVFVKTLQGEEEVRSRSLQLDRSARLVLILVDGVINAAELIQKLPGTDNVPGLLTSLWRDGLIEPAVKTDGLADTKEPRSSTDFPELPVDISALAGTIHELPARETRIEPMLSAAAANAEQPEVEPVDAVPDAPVYAPPKALEDEKRTPVRSALQDASLWVHGQTERVHGVYRGLVWALFGGLILAVVSSFVLPWVPLPIHPDFLTHRATQLCGAGANYDSTKLSVWPSPSVAALGMTETGSCPALGEARFMFSWSSLLHGEPQITGLQFRNAEVSASHALDLFARLSLTSLGLKEGTVILFNDVNLSFVAYPVLGLSGEAKVVNGQLNDLVLTDHDALHRVNLAQARGKVMVKLDIKQLQMNDTMLTALEFDGLDDQSGYILGKLNAEIGSGHVSGLLNLMPGGNRISGRLQLKGVPHDALPLDALSIFNEGVVDGDINILANSAPVLQDALDSLSVAGRLQIRDGSLTGADLLEVAQSGRSMFQAGGRTLFSNAAANLVSDKKAWKLEGFALQGAAIEAAGMLERAGKGPITGSLSLQSAKLRLPKSAWRVNGEPGTWRFNRIGG